MSDLCKSVNRHIGRVSRHRANLFNLFDVLEFVISMAQ